jgi:hypothetical protein
MMSRFLRRISKLGLFLSDLIASATGCFVFTRGFRFVALNEEESHSTSPIRHNDGPPKSLAGIGAALLLVAFASSEALATVLALRR